ncbi:hypothetical protein CesoFtcFv8_021619 [Champsocephalus esox]|uniref:Secreted protein n=1 Tax=Champsocephalus esox TaxID=159716 RepID=A0AAN8BA39_9TELE|nr:hypothetical protein CesoFtcFv8_021619 [Champsocephalus esox]
MTDAALWKSLHIACLLRRLQAREPCSGEEEAEHYYANCTGVSAPVSLTGDNVCVLASCIFMKAKQPPPHPISLTRGFCSGV